ncbi:MAG: DnaB-like helicase C-terminal domain-containing protein [Lachnospiraceae bacterium]|nr:DnaB-like helicase C-terminal domain-containing protein [Lachnospiraceae bacterium]
MEVNYESAEELLNRTEEFLFDARLPGSLLTGFRDLDYLTGGLNPGELICLAGRPCMGKTAFVLRMLMDICMNGEKNCLYFSLAETGLQLMKRLIVMDCLDESVLKDPGNAKNRQFTDSIERIRTSGLYISEKACSIGEIKECCMDLCSKEKTDLVIIDHFQRIRGSGQNAKDNKPILDELRTIAKELNCPVVIISQLGRNTERRKDHRPFISDLTDIGLMDEHFDKIFFVYRDDYYDFDSERKGVADIIVAKNRFGGIGIVSLAFIHGLALFENLV